MTPTIINIVIATLATVVIGGVLWYVNKKSGQPLPTPTGDPKVDIPAMLANFQAGLNNLTIVKDAKAFAADSQTSATFLAVAAIGHEVSNLVDDSRKVAVQTAVNALLTELVAVAAPPAKA